MTTRFHRNLARRAYRCVTWLAVSASTVWASAGEFTHITESVTAPPQDVCVGQGCAVNTQSYAYHATQWRRWPGTRKVDPAPGRGGRVEPTLAKPLGSAPSAAPANKLPEALPNPPSAKTRTPQPATEPGTPTARPPVTRTVPPANTLPTPPSATGANGTRPNTSAPPVDLDKLFPEEASPPSDTPSTTPEVNEPLPPFDAEDSDARNSHGANRTLNALSAGLNGKRPKTKAATSSDPWKAAPLKKVRDEQRAPAGPMLNEPNLMSAPDDGPQLESTPDTKDGWQPSASVEAPGNVVPTASWEEAQAAGPTRDSEGANPLRSSGGGRKANPLRR